MVDVKGKWAFVTGASRGIGKQICLFLAERGCNLILHSRSLEHTLGLKQTLEAKGVKVYAVEAELSVTEQVDSMLAKVDELVPCVDFVFNNAAIQTTYYTKFWDLPLDDFRKSFEVNVISVVQICRHFGPKMIERGFGRILCTTSGIRQEAEQTAYSASKAAITKYVQDMAPKFEGTGVTINLLDPGWLRTDLGGPNAPNAVETVVPGAVIPVMLDNGLSGCWFSAMDYVGMSDEEAAEAASKVKNDLLCVPA